MRSVAGAAVALLWVPLLLAGSALASPQTAQEIDDCVEANAPRESSALEVDFVSRDRAGAKTTIEANMYWKDFDGKPRVLLKLDAPPKYRGAAVLFIEKDEDKRDIFMYLPELGRVKRITGRMMSGPIFGTDFSYEEFEQLEGLTEGMTSKRLDDATVGDRDVFVVERRPEEGVESSYTRTVHYVEKEHCVPVQVEFFGKGDRLHKVVEADLDSLEAVGDKWIARRMTMRDVRDETDTEMRIEEVRFDEKLSRKLFSTRELEKSR